MSGLRIALDASYSLDSTPTGVAVYSREILAGLAARHRAEWLWCCRPHRLVRALVRQVPRGVHRRPFWDGWVPSCDLFHGLNQRLPKAPMRRAVATFHDLFVMTGEYSTPEFRARFADQARQAANRADRVIAVSRFTATQVHDLLGVDRDRIDVVHHGHRGPVDPPNCPREPLILFVGAIQARKNIARLVEAFKSTPPEWRLVLAGSAGFGARDIIARIESSPRRSDITVTGWIPDAELRDLWSRASIFAFPSLDEGFGMPILDAMAWGVPVLTSNRSAMPEVADGAALEVDPFDTEAIAAGLCALAGDHAFRADLVRRGRLRVLEATWERAVDGTWAAYQKVT